MSHYTDNYNPTIRRSIRNGELLSRNSYGDHTPVHPTLDPRYTLLQNQVAALWSTSSRPEPAHAIDTQGRSVLVDLQDALDLLDTLPRFAHKRGEVWSAVVDNRHVQLVSRPNEEEQTLRDLCFTDIEPATPAPQPIDVNERIQLSSPFDNPLERLQSTGSTQFFTSSSTGPTRVVQIESQTWNARPATWAQVPPTVLPPDPAVWGPADVAIPANPAPANEDPPLEAPAVADRPADPTNLEGLE